MSGVGFGMRVLIMVGVLVLLLVLCADSSRCCARQILAPGASTITRISAATTAATNKGPWVSDRGAKATHIGDLVVSLAENGIDVCGGGRHGSQDIAGTALVAQRLLLGRRARTG